MALWDCCTLLRCAGFRAAVLYCGVRALWGHHCVRAGFVGLLQLLRRAGFVGLLYSTVRAALWGCCTLLWRAGFVGFVLLAKAVGFVGLLYSVAAHGLCGATVLYCGMRALWGYSIVYKALWDCCTYLQRMALWGHCTLL